MVVVANRYQESLADSLASVSVIQKADIEKFRYADLYELLAGQQGMQLTRSGGPGSPISVHLRGANSTQTLILVDGIPFASQGAVGAFSSIEALAISQIERIEILRGNASAVYGPGAAGGVINILTTAQSRASEGTQSKVEWGSHQSRTLQAGLRKKLEEGLLSLSVSDERSDGRSSLNPNRFPGLFINPDRNGYQKQSLNLGWRQKLGENTNWSLSLLSSDLQSSYDNPYAMTATERWRTDSKLQMMGTQISHQILPNWITNLSYASSNIQQGTLTNELPNAEYGTIKTRHQQWKWDNQLALGVRTQLSFGYANQMSNLDTARTATDWYVNVGESIDVQVRESVRNSRFYAGLQQKIDALSWRLNVSHENLPGGQSSDTFLLGVGYDLRHGYRLSAARSSAVQAPTVGQLYDAGFGGNARLRPEYSSSNELSLQHRDDRSLWRLVVFDVDYTDMIAAGRKLVEDTFWAAQMITQYENVGRARNRGAEFSYARQWSSWRLQWALTHQNPENLSSDKPILNRARQFGNVTLSHQWSADTALHARWLVTAERWTPRVDDYRTNALMPGYAVLNLSADHRISPSWRLSLSVLNALDKAYEHIQGYAGLPRSVYIGLRYTNP